MDPISTSMFALYLVATPAIKGRSDNMRQVQSPAIYLLGGAEHNMAQVLLGETRSADELGHPSARDLLFQKLFSYMTDYGDDEKTVERVTAANDFLRKLPGSYPLPNIMRSHDGEIGMYWDNGDDYIDIEIESEGELSLFAKNRTSKTRRFIDNIAISDIDPEWFSEYLSSMVKPIPIVHETA